MAPGTVPRTTPPSVPRTAPRTPPRKLHIAYVTAELAPFARTGGLGEVAAALSKALVSLGHKVTLFLPRYGMVPFPAGKLVGSIHVPVDGAHRSAGYYLDSLGKDLQVVFVEHPPFFDRPQLYGEGGRDYEDNRLRFAFLSRAAIEYFRGRGERPHVFHAHDWHTGLVPVYLKAFYGSDPTLHRSPTVFTIHNLAHQGNFGPDSLGILGLPWNLGTSGALDHDGGISYMKGGILFSEILTAVSPQYAREIQGPAVAHGFDGIVRARAADLVGILNGVDYEEWDPRTDRHIARNYSPEELAGKAECKTDLLRGFGLPVEPGLPVVGIVSRLVAQKGFDVVVRAWWDLLQRPVRMVVLGTGEPAIEQGFRDLVARAPDRFAARFAYDDALAHKVQAGADILLMPSRFEPCGLTQMYALRYGTVPIVRATGGLVDTVEPYDTLTRDGTGFRFEHPDGTGLIWALDRALAVYRDREAWEELMKNGMSRDFSWERSARDYVEVYRRAMARA